MEATLKGLSARIARQRQNGVVDCYRLPEEPFLPDSQGLVDSWPPERIAALREKTKLPVKRIIALLGISQPGFSRLSLGDFTPSPSLCRRMQQLEEMAERGELHGEYTPSTAEMRRRMALFRAWWLSRPPTVDLPLISCHLSVQWGQGVHHRITIPVKHIPQLRLKEWKGLVPVVKAVTVALRKVAMGNSRLLWKQAESEYWFLYARDKLPAIVTERAKILPKARAEAKKRKEESSGS
jgi:hypothetical protein